MADDSNKPERPWETTPLPYAAIMFECPGETWHDHSFTANHLIWMAGRAGTAYPVDGFYCRTCVFSATEFSEEPGPKRVTGPTLSKELQRRGLVESDTLEEVRQ